VYRRVWEEHRVRPRGPARYAPSAAPKVLFVRLDGLGDVALTTPCFEAVKRRYPDARVDVVVRPAATPLLEGDPHVDRVLTLEAPWHGRWRLGSIRDVWLMARRLRRERYDYVLTLRRDLDDAVFARLCGGRHTLGFYARRTRPFLSGWRDFRPDLHTAENQLRLMALLGCERDGLRPTVACTSGDPQRIDALLGDAAGERTLIGLAPFGSSETKTIPASQAGALIDALATSMPARLVLLGSAADRPRADAVLGAASAPVVDLAGRTTIPELCDVLRRCRLVVCVDSGPMHLAAALGVPTVVLFGGEDPVLWGPYGDAPHQVLRVLDARRRAAVRAIPLEMVLAAVRELLQTTQTAAVRPREPGEVTA